jgi:E3 ubiquitin-protein ligase RFWD2
VQQYLLSSDYEGLVHLWDLHSAKIVRQWEAHERRIWVVDSCGLQPDQFATGSDDGTVKVRYGRCAAGVSVSRCDVHPQTSWLCICMHVLRALVKH